MFGPFRGESPRVLCELQDEVNRLINRFWHGGVTTPPFDGQDWAPPWDVYEDADQYVACIEIAGMAPEDVDVTYSGQTLSVKGNKPSIPPEGSTTCLRQERRFGSFARTIHLPEPVDADAVAATCNHGLLKVVLPKKADPSKRTVKVEVT